MHSVALVLCDVIFHVMKTELDPSKRQKFNDF